MSTPAPDRTREDSYHVAHSNVDGYGHVGTFPTAEAAVAEAQRLQRLALDRGNHHGYVHVATHSWCVRDERGNPVSHGSRSLWRYEPDPEQDLAGPWYLIEVEDPVAAGRWGSRTETVAAVYVAYAEAEAERERLARAYRTLGANSCTSFRVDRTPPEPARPLGAHSPAEMEPLDDGEYDPADWE